MTLHFHHSTCQVFAQTHKHLLWLFCLCWPFCFIAQALDTTSSSFGTSFPSAPMNTFPSDFVLPCSPSADSPHPLEPFLIASSSFVTRHSEADTLFQQRQQRFVVTCVQRIKQIAVASGGKMPNLMRSFVMLNFSESKTHRLAPLFGAFPHCFIKFCHAPFRGGHIVPTAPTKICGHVCPKDQTNCCCEWRADAQSHALFCHAQLQRVSNAWAHQPTICQVKFRMIKHSGRFDGMTKLANALCQSLLRMFLHHL